MLVLRSAIRSRLGISMIPLFTRCYHPSRRLLDRPSMEPNSSQRPWYQRDGGPHSEWKIYMYVLISGVATGTIYTALSERLDDLRKEDQRKDDFDPALAGKGLQRIDVEYSSYDFSKEEDLTIYFSKVGTCLIGSMKIKEEWDQYVKGRAIQMKAFESRPELIQLRQDHHESFREAMEKIHNIIMQNNDPSETAKAVLKLWLNCFIVYEDFLDKVRQVLVNSEGLEGDTYEIIG